MCESPRWIERHQQRDNFRVKPIYPSKVILHLADSPIHMEIDNVSLGGVYCYCDNKFKPLFEQEDKHLDMDLSFTLRDDCLVIPIQGARVNRIESKHRPRQFGIAFEFIKVAKEARRILVQQIYELQREFLKKRLKVME
jgi:c-di-GMP-binding flagellar brake protein YcgR